MEDPGHNSGQAAEPSSPDLALRHRGRDLRLVKPVTLLGRAADCDLVFDSTLVSRHHARVHLVDGAARVEDLGSRNGVLVNSQPIRGQQELQVGDSVALGDEVVELVLFGSMRPREPSPTVKVRSRPTMTRVEPPPSVHPQATQRTDEHTRRGNAFELLGGVVEKALALGHGEEAERMLQLHLLRVQEQARAGHALPPELTTTAASFAVKLALATGKGTWVDYCFRLHLPLRRPLPVLLVDELYTVLRRVSGVDRALLREYVDVLRGEAARLSPAERFALQRIEGLERLLSL